jgi:hypothetical protein
MDEHKKHDHNMQGEFKEHLDGAMDTLKEIKNPGKFDFKKEFMNAIEILKLNEKTMHEISTRKTTATAAFLFILMGVVATSLGTYFMFPSAWRPSVTYLLISMVVSLVAAFVAIFAIDFVASKFFKGKGNFGQLFRVMGYAYVVMIPYILIAVAPGLMSIIGLVAGVWMIVVTFKAIAVVKKLNPTHIIFTLLIVGVALFVIYSVLGYFGIGGYGYGVSAGSEINSLNEALEALGRF